MKSSIFKTYSKLSNITKILLFTSILLILIVFFKSSQSISKEGFISNEQEISRTGLDVYDDFYVGIYDYLVTNDVKNDFEVGKLLDLAKPSDQSIILDIGCGKGHHVNKIASNNIKVTGIDISPSMIKEAQNLYPNQTFKIGDANNMNLFAANSFTHILCLYFTIYYFENKRHFFNNCMDWLYPGGYLIIHLVDRERFDPILPPGNPLFIVSPQKYAKNRITETKVKFNEFDYKANFELEDETAYFNETFKFKDGKKRTNSHKLYMEDTEKILTIAQQCGFTLHSIIDLIKVGYDYQYLYVFVKPG